MSIPEFKKSDVKIKRLVYYSGDIEGAEKFIEKYNFIEKTWKYKLTQSENITEWIEYPENIPENIQKTFRNYISQVEEMLKNNNSLTVLDVGCLGGYLYDFMKKYIPFNKTKIHYVGIDIRPDAIKGAKRLHRNCKNAKFMVGDIFKLSKVMSKAVFDVVMCSRVLIHLPHFDEGMRNLIYATRLKTFIIAKITGKTTCALKIKINVKTGELMPYFYRTFSYKDIERIAEENQVKFQIIPSPSNQYSLIILTKE